jgi:hypothetical protein
MPFGGGPILNRHQLLAAALSLGNIPAIEATCPPNLLEQERLMVFEKGKLLEETVLDL